MSAQADNRPSQPRISIRGQSLPHNNLKQKRPAAMMAAGRFCVCLRQRFQDFSGGGAVAVFVADFGEEDFA